MLDRLPESIDPIQFADKQGVLKGRIAVNTLNRLADMLADDSGWLSVELFSRQGRLPIIEGQLEGMLQIACQNCLDAVEWPISHTVKLGIVASAEQAERLPEDLEPLLVSGEKILVKDMIEDEILLLLPTYPKHGQPCSIKIKTIGLQAEARQTTPKPNRENPFSILANLKKTGDL